MAADLYVRLGYRVLARRRRVGKSEADLVVERAGRRVLVEVKTVVVGNPFDRVDRDKEGQLGVLAGWLRCRRIDVVGVRLGADGAHLHVARGW